MPNNMTYEQFLQRHSEEEAALKRSLSDRRRRLEQQKKQNVAQALKQPLWERMLRMVSKRWAEQSDQRLAERLGKINETYKVHHERLDQGHREEMARMSDRERNWSAQRQGDTTRREPNQEVMERDDEAEIAGRDASLAYLFDKLAITKKESRERLDLEIQEKQILLGPDGNPKDNLPKTLEGVQQALDGLPAKYKPEREALEEKREGTRQQIEQSAEIRHEGRLRMKAQEARRMQDPQYRQVTLEAQRIANLKAELQKLEDRRRGDSSRVLPPGGLVRNASPARARPAGPQDTTMSDRERNWSAQRQGDTTRREPNQEVMERDDEAEIAGRDASLAYLFDKLAITKKESRERLDLEIQEKQILLGPDGNPKDNLPKTLEGVQQALDGLPAKYKPEREALEEKREGTRQQIEQSAEIRHEGRLRMKAQEARRMQDPQYRQVTLEAQRIANLKAELQKLEDRRRGDSSRVLPPGGLVRNASPAWARPAGPQDTTYTPTAPRPSTTRQRR
ncbi:hypothetical protein RJT17_36820 [Streptomyces sp. P5-A9]|uniref:hypothetical protein n=1 Tax=Streptomyces sp. P5-A9 TaxID=3071730 RepID=UPI002FC84C11